MEGTPCFKIKLTKNNGEIENWFFSSDNFALIKKIARSKNQEMDNAMLTTFYSDYRDVKGIKISFKSVAKSGEQTILTITLNKVEINVLLPDTEFE